MRKLLVLVVAVMVLTMVPGLPAPADAARPLVDVRLARVGTLDAGGETVTFSVRARCVRPLEVLEALATVSQDGFVEVFFPLSCTGTWQRFELSASVLDGEPPFLPGRAQASALVLVEDPTTGMTFDAQHSVRMKLKVDA